MNPTFLDEQRPQHTSSGLASHKTIPGIGNFTVISTNGLIAHCVRVDGLFMHLHHSEIDFPKTETYSGPRKTKAEKPQPKKVKRKKLDDLLAEYL